MTCTRWFTEANTSVKHTKLPKLYYQVNTTSKSSLTIHRICTRVTRKAPVAPQGTYVDDHTPVGIKSEPIGNQQVLGSLANG
jgi:hypothetical protein